MRFTAKISDHRVEQSDLLVARLIIIDKLPDNACGDKGNGHRHENDGFGDFLVAAAVGQNSNEQPEADTSQRADKHPQQIVAQRRSHQVVAEDRRIVAESHEFL
ncbi:hypothetical protein D3C81_1646960 [compost metagenome]